MLPFRRRGNVLAPSTGRFGHVFGPASERCGPVPEPSTGARTGQPRAPGDGPQPTRPRTANGLIALAKLGEASPRRTMGPMESHASRRHRIGLDSRLGAEAPWTPMARHFRLRAGRAAIRGAGQARCEATVSGRWPHGRGRRTGQSDRFPASREYVGPGVAHCKGASAGGSQVAGDDPSSRLDTRRFPLASCGHRPGQPKERPMRRATLPLASVLVCPPLLFAWCSGHSMEDSDGSHNHGVLQAL